MISSEMSKREFLEFERLLKLSEMDMGDKESMKALIIKFIDEGFSMCMTCDPQIRAAFKRLNHFWQLNRVIFQKKIYSSEL